MIVQINFDTILTIWTNQLWKERTSKIETHSAMLYKNSTYDIKNFDYTPTFFAYYVNESIAGVNSGHMCNDGSYRSRGLYVHSDFRKQGIGRKLLIATLQQGIQEKAKFVWSYPRQSSWNTYQSAGFILDSEWEVSETGTNAYCKIDLA